jgi:hypothetical protein
MNKLNRKSLATRFAVAPLAIVALYYFAETGRPFVEVYQPLLLYYALAVPAFFLVERFRRRAA